MSITNKSFCQLNGVLPARAFVKLTACLFKNTSIGWRCLCCWRNWEVESVCISSEQQIKRCEKVVTQCLHLLYASNIHFSFSFRPLLAHFPDFPTAVPELLSLLFHLRRSPLLEARAIWTLPCLHQQCVHVPIRHS